MPKSKYPQQLDTSIEIPPVRDNILEVGSDVINSLRSAIFNIEKTLGINPQGAVGNSLAERISKSLDANGNITKEALDRSNVLSGPILDSDVSSVASIKESKLKLDFPTKVLQDQVSTISSRIDSIISSLEEISVGLAVHTNPNSINRHPALSISVAQYNSAGSDIAIKDIAAGSVQSTFEDLFDSHINYTGASISLTNNSHRADQIYFDNTSVSSIAQNNLQSAIEELASISYNSETSHQELLHSNGILRSGKITTSDNDSVGNVLAEGILVSFLKSPATSPSYSQININQTLPIGDFPLEKSDILTLSVLTGSPSFVGNYEILDYQVSSGNLTSITVWGNFAENSTSATRAKVSKKIRKEVNLASLLVSSREEANKTSARSIQICNPNSVKVISSLINPLAITLTNRYIDISINSSTPVTIDLYNSAIARQTLDGVISRINEQCAEGAHPFLSYRLDLEGGGSELVIAHNLPDTLEEKYTLTISRSSDSGIDAAGFSYIEDKVVQSEFGTTYYIQGKNFEGLSPKLISSSLIFLPSSTVITSSSGVDFIASGVKRFDLITIVGAPNPSDDGSYVISSVSNNQITIDAGQIPSGFAGSSSESTSFKIFSNIASLTEIVFNKISGTYGTSLCDIFLDQNQNIFINKLFEHEVRLLGIKSLVSLVDFEGFAQEVNYTLTVEKNHDNVAFSIDGGPKVEVRGVQNYIWVSSGKYNCKFKLYIPDVDDITISSPLVTSGLTIYGFASENAKTNLKLARFAFDNYTGNGRIVGGSKSGRIFSKLHRGNIGKDEISTEAINTLINTPREELRSNGVVKGLEILNPTVTATKYVFDLQAGVCYVTGKRLEISERLSVVVDINALVNDKIFIGIDDFGNLVTQEATLTCDAPFEPSIICILGSLEYNGTSTYFIDQRLFINDLDLKVLNSISVSPQPGMGHFSELGKALQYAKRFSQAFPKAGIPTVHLKSGTHTIEVDFDNSDISYAAWFAQAESVKREEVLNGLAEVGLVLDFGVNIVGEGDSTELVIRTNYTFSDTSYTFKSGIFVVGDGLTTTISYPTSRFNSGLIKISNLKMNNSRIVLYDLNILDGANPLAFMVEIDSVTFDHQNFGIVNPIDNEITSISLVEADDIITNKGNLSINNCRFITEDGVNSGSAIYINSATRSKNISITNNKLYNSINGASLISADIVTINNSDSGANILVLGNMTLRSTSTSDGVRSSIYNGSNNWSDRISRKLTVGQNVIADDFSYHTEKTISKVFTFKETSILDEFIFNSVFVTAPTVARKIFTNSDYSYNISYANIPNLAAVSVPINDVVNNCKIKTIEIGIPLITSGNYNINLRLNKLDKFFWSLSGQNIIEFQETRVGTFSSTPSTKRIAVLSFDLSSLNIMVDGDNFYYIQVKNLNATDLELYFVSVVSSFTNVSNALGII